MLGFIIIYNPLIILSLGAGIAFATLTSARLGDRPAFMIGGAIAVAIDLVLRLKVNKEENSLVAPSSGGHVWFIPGWIIGAVMLVGGIFMAPAPPRQPGGAPVPAAATTPKRR